MKSVFASICAIVLLAACDDSQRAPIGPTSGYVPGPSPAPTHKLFGVVTAAGVPVAGAEVSELQTVFGDDCFTPQELSGTTSDASGSYTLPAVRDASTSVWASWVRAHKPGYFTDFQRPWISRETQLDFVLDPWVHISLGEVIRGTVRAGDPTCRGNSYGLPGFCHRFALKAPSTGTLEVTLAWPNTRPDVVLDVVRPGGIPCAEFSWPGRALHQLKIPADAGATYEIRVVDDGNASPLNYELTTALR